MPSSLKFMEHFKNGHIWPSVSGPALLVFQAAAQELWMACTQFSIHLLPQFCEACLLRIVKEIPFGILWATSAAHKKTSQQLRPHGIWHFCQNAQRRISVNIWANLSDLLEIPSSEQHKKSASGWIHWVKTPRGLCHECLLTTTSCSCRAFALPHHHEWVKMVLLLYVCY